MAADPGTSAGGGQAKLGIPPAHRSPSGWAAVAAALSSLERALLPCDKLSALVEVHLFAPLLQCRLTIIWGRAGSLSKFKRRWLLLLLLLL